MKELTINKNDAGQRLDRYLGKALPLLPAPLAQKYIRIKRIKLNGRKAERDIRLKEGDVLQCYINDEFFDKPNEDNAFLSIFKPQLDIIYEDDNIILVNKKPGVVVHPDGTEYVNTLLTHLQAYLYQKMEWGPNRENTFAPALCNRIDRNTGGIVIAAKNAETLRIMNQKIRDRELQKLYLCIVYGHMTPEDGTLKNYLTKDEVKKKVTIHNKQVENSKTCITKYRTLCHSQNMSLIECDLITGRTHQIRAQFAHAGHALLGDGKYGFEKNNKKYGRTIQALYSYKLEFQFTTDAGILEYLDGKSWAVNHVDFVDEFFPNYHL